jgi:hypothetical protein
MQKTFILGILFFTCTIPLHSGQHQNQKYRDAAIHGRVSDLAITPVYKDSYTQGNNDIRVDLPKGSDPKAIAITAVYRILNPEAQPAVAQDSSKNSPVAPETSTTSPLAPEAPTPSPVAPGDSVSITVTRSNSTSYRSPDFSTPSPIHEPNPSLK